MEKECIHCGACTLQCEFLKKYQMDLGDDRRVEELAYHCFLCGKCKTVCPVGLDGKEIFLKKRQELVVANKGKIVVDGYEMLIKEKQNYIFRNYRNLTSGSVLFPGCNFPSYYPQTTKKLSTILKQEAEIGTVYDCCGKPIAELGLVQQENRIIERMNREFQGAGVTEIIVLCPNCYCFLNGRLDIPVTSIYEVLTRMGIGKKIEAEEVNIFPPCPDRENRLWIKHMSSYLPTDIYVIDEIQCCGLGGCARGKEPDVSFGFTEKLRRIGYSSVYTYCASCAGKFARDRMQGIHHVLAEVLETYEELDVAKSMVNRAKSKFW